MYDGTIKKIGKYNNKLETKAQCLMIEQVKHNGVLLEQYVIKTKDYSSDPNIKVRDFDIRNLQAIGVLETLKQTQLKPSTDKIEANANAAQEILDQYEIIKEIENEQTKTQTENE